MTILYGAGISNSTRHLGVNLRWSLLGGGAGKLKAAGTCGIRATPRTPTC